MFLRARPKTKFYFKSIFPPSVLAYVSSKDVDFQWKDGQTSLDPVQQKYLEKNLNFRWRSMVNIKQVHGDKIIVANENYVQESGKLEEADAVVTGQKNIAIAVRTADCIPLFLCDAENEVIAVVHAGWKGTQQNISAKTVSLMKKIWGSDPSTILVGLGPSIRECCYEVGSEFKAHFPHDVKERRGKLYLDLVSVNKRQLFQEGIELDNISEEGGCTVCTPGWHSFRRDKDKAGRMLSFMMMKE